MPLHYLAQQCAAAINASTLAGTPNNRAAIVVSVPWFWRAPATFPAPIMTHWRLNGTRHVGYVAADLLVWLETCGGVKVTHHVAEHEAGNA